MKVERPASRLQRGFKFKTNLTNERSNNIQFNKLGGGGNHLKEFSRNYQLHEDWLRNVFSSERDPEVVAAYKLTQVNSAMLLQLKQTSHWEVIDSSIVCKTQIIFPVLSTDKDFCWNSV